MRVRPSLFVLLALSSCNKDKATLPPGTDADRLIATVESLVPHGTSFDSALTELGSHGLSCSFVRDGSEFGAQYPDYILCAMVDSSGSTPARAYRVGLLLADGRVANVLARSAAVSP